MADCNLCGKPAVFHENLGYWVHPLLGYRHGMGYCFVKISRYADTVMVDGKPRKLGFLAPLREDRIAAAVVEAAIKMQLSPDVQPKREGDYLILKR